MHNKTYSHTCDCEMSTAIRGKNGQWQWYFVEGAKARIDDGYCTCYNILGVDEQGPFYAEDDVDEEYAKWLLNNKG